MGLPSISWDSRFVSLQRNPSGGLVGTLGVATSREALERTSLRLPLDSRRRPVRDLRSGVRNLLRARGLSTGNARSRLRARFGPKICSEALPHTSDCGWRLQ